MVDLSGLPPRPGTWPDPRSCKDFAEWLRELTKISGVKQRTIAEVAGSTPQAVTKWLNGGMIEVERLARIAAWADFPFEELRRLIDEPKLGILPSTVGSPRAAYATPKNAQKRPEELVLIWSKLSADNRQQLLGMAKLLLSRQARRK